MSEIKSFNGVIKEKYIIKHLICNDEYCVIIKYDEFSEIETTKVSPLDYFRFPNGSRISAKFEKINNLWYPIYNRK